MIRVWGGKIDGNSYPCRRVRSENPLAPYVIQRERPLQLFESLQDTTTLTMHNNRLTNDTQQKEYVLIKKKRFWDKRGGREL